jgi:hypothetical protein
MKHLWQVCAVGATLVGAGCADGTTRPSPEGSSVPATIVVPAILESAAGQFAFNADGSRLYIQDGPGDGSGECYDICDPIDDGGSGGGDGSGGTGEYPEPLLQGPQYTEARFDSDVLKGHAEMTLQFADHASQNMTLSTWRPEGSVIGSQKFTTARIWPFPVPLAQTLTTDGSMPAPICGARGQGISVHEISSSASSTMTNSRTETTHSTIMNQPACTSTSGTQSRETTETSSSGGQLRICLREDHYSSTGQYIYTETIYCYYTAAA